MLSFHEKYAKIITKTTKFIETINSQLQNNSSIVYALCSKGKSWLFLERMAIEHERMLRASRAAQRLSKI